VARARGCAYNLRVPCPDAEELARPDALDAEVAAHVASCEACARIVDVLRADGGGDGG